MSRFLSHVWVWPIASLRCLAKFGRYWRHSGHWLRLGLDASVANDPLRTSNASLCEKTNLRASKDDCLAAKATDCANGQYNLARNSILRPRA